MSSKVIIVDEDTFSKLTNKIDLLTGEVRRLCARNAPGLKESWLVSDEVCKLLKVSKRKLQSMRDNNEIKYKQSGRKIYYRASDIECYIENC